MRKLFVLLGAALIALLVMSSAASAQNTTCNTTLTGATVTDDLVVPENGSCTIVNTTVGDDVKVGKNAFFQADNSRIGDDVSARRALTVFLNTGTTVGGDVETSKTFQVFIFDNTVGGHIEVHGTDQTVNVCGNTVDGRIEVADSGQDILVGDPQAAGCAGNTVLNRHRIRVEDNSVDVELVVRGNTLNKGDLEVNDNKGTADKFVQDNTGGHALECHGNSSPFTASGNTGFDKQTGQCAIPTTTCNEAHTGEIIPGNVVVPENGSCTLSASSVGGNVKVGKNAFFQATGSKIAGDVTGSRALTVFIDTGTTVSGEVDTSSAFQVFVFNATLEDDLEVSRSGDKVQVCGTSIDGNVEIDHSQFDILFGDPRAVDCAGNTVRNGHSARFDDNNAEVEFTVRGNTFEGGDLSVKDTEGTADKFVQDNTGGGVLSCSGNETPFTGTTNGFTTEQGQCAEI